MGKAHGLVVGALQEEKGVRTERTEAHLPGGHHTEDQSSVSLWDSTQGARCWAYNRLSVCTARCAT